jgi:hypothetical protein
MVQLSFGPIFRHHERMPGKIFIFPNNSIADYCVITAMLLFQSAAMASYPEISFSAESIEHDNFTIHQVQARLNPEGEFQLAAARISMNGMAHEIKGFSVAGVMQHGQYSVDLKFERQELEIFKGLDGLPPELDWLSRGYIDAELKIRQPPDSPSDITVQLGIGNIGFDSPDGRFAAEALSMDVEVSALLSAWSKPNISGAFRSGELLIDDFYRDFSDGAMEFALQPQWQDGKMDIRSIRLTDNHSLNVEGRLVLDSRPDSNSWKVEISQLELEFPGAYERYIEPVAAAWTLNGLAVTGRIAWSGQWSAGQFSSGDLGITDLSIVDTQRRRFAVTGLDARMRPGDHAFDSRLAWRGLLLGRINLGQGEVALESEPGKFAIVQPLVLEVLGGRLNLQELKVILPGGSGEAAGELDIRLRAGLEEMDMEQLTAAFGWPSFSGKISGQIPGVKFEDGVLEVEGEILVNVFDGLLTLEDLRIERPFGVLPSLAANVEAENLDLELLTSTFSFGRISGRIDGYVRDLRMLDWKPVAFDAWLGTPENQRGSKGISRQAVNHLTTLGGGSATTALTSPIMRLFNNFSYKRLGLGCRMQNNICEVRGVSEDDISVLIMEGAGVPKITIKVFNRSVDWPQLLAQLVAASEGETIRVGD